jgi:hypothetical protein
VPAHLTLLVTLARPALRIISVQRANRVRRIVGHVIRVLLVPAAVSPQLRQTNLRHATVSMAGVGLAERAHVMLGGKIHQPDRMDPSARFVLPDSSTMDLGSVKFALRIVLLVVLEEVVRSAALAMFPTRTMPPNASHRLLPMLRPAPTVPLIKQELVSRAHLFARPAPVLPHLIVSSVVPDESWTSRTPAQQLTTSVAVRVPI